MSRWAGFSSRRASARRHSGSKPEYPCYRTMTYSKGAPGEVMLDGTVSDPVACPSMLLYRLDEPPFGARSARRAARALATSCTAVRLSRGVVNESFGWALHLDDQRHGAREWRSGAALDGHVDPTRCPKPTVATGRPNRSRPVIRFCLVSTRPAATIPCSRVVGRLLHRGDGTRRPRRRTRAARRRRRAGAGLGVVDRSGARGIRALRHRPARQPRGDATGRPRTGPVAAGRRCLRPLLRDHLIRVARRVSCALPTREARSRTACGRTHTGSSSFISPA